MIKRSSIFYSFTALITSLCFFSCRPDGPRDIRSYYFPIDQLYDGLAYEYQPVGDNRLTPEYWYYRSFDQDSLLILTGQYYSYEFDVKQFYSERIVENGTLLRDYFLYEYNEQDSLLTVPVNIEVANGFPFLVSQIGSIFLSRLQWTDPTQVDMTTTHIRNRHFLGDTTYTIDGQSHDCVAFATKELIETEQEGFQELRYNGIEFYARGIGLIYYRKEVSPDLILEYQLADRYPMEELVRRSEQLREQQTE